MISLCSDVFLPAPLTQTIVISGVGYLLPSLIFDTYVSFSRYTTTEIVPTLKTHHGLGFQTFNSINYARALLPDHTMCLFHYFVHRNMMAKLQLVSNLRRPSSKSLMRGYGIPETAPHPCIWAGIVNLQPSCIRGLYSHLGDQAVSLVTRDVTKLWRSGDAHDDQLWRHFAF